jgi:hypothetical protein
MHPLAKKIDTERRLREIVEMAEVSPPDRIEYGEQCVRFFWLEEKVVVVVDLD